MTTKSPTISIVTPSFNRKRFLGDAMASVIGQEYPALEYVVMDGGSTDGSVDVIRECEDRLAHWSSEADAGQYEAINKGFARTSGEIMGWLNSDDAYLPGALSVVGEIFAQNPEVQWLTTLYPLVMDGSGRVIRCAPRGPFSAQAFYRGDNLPGGAWRAGGWIQQESTFWRRSLWEKAGGRMDMDCGDAADFDLWARFFKIAELYCADAPLGIFRRHGDQKTEKSFERYHQDALASLVRHGGRPASRLASAIAVGAGRISPNRWKKGLTRIGLAKVGPVCAYDTETERWLCRREGKSW